MNFEFIFVFFLSCSSFLSMADEVTITLEYSMETSSELSTLCTEIIRSQDCKYFRHPKTRNFHIRKIFLLLSPHGRTWQDLFHLGFNSFHFMLGN